MEKEREQRHKFEMRKLELETARMGKSNVDGSSSTLAKIPKLPIFDDGKDDLDSYSQRCERFATTSKWDRDVWATFLCTLLTGRHGVLKAALLHRYGLNAEGYRKRFRKEKPEGTESPKQFLVRLGSLLEKWTSSAGAKDVPTVWTSWCVNNSLRSVPKIWQYISRNSNQIPLKNWLRLQIDFWSLMVENLLKLQKSPQIKRNRTCKAKLLVLLFNVITVRCLDTNPPSINSLSASV